MDSVKRILSSIALTSQFVHTSAAWYSNTRGIRRLREYSLVRLEIELQAIASACRAILEILNNPFLSCQYRLDDRLMDWLSNTEPETCLATLEEMEKLLKVGRGVRPFSEFAPTELACPEDETFEAVVMHFYASKAHFHFLLTTNTWNYETGGLGRNVNNTVDEIMQDNNQLRSIAKNCMVDEEESRRKQETVSQKLDKLLHFLDGLDCTAKQKETTSLRQSDTCMWLRYTNEYKSWRDGDDSFLLLQGKAGAGKSVLASSVIEDLLETKHEEEFLLYFYCDFRTKRSTSSVEVMRSILAQLISHLRVAMVDPEDLLDDLLKETNSRVEAFYNAKRLSHYLSKLAKLCRRKPFVVVDALDECREAETLLDGLVISRGDVRIFVTSRPLQSIINILSAFPSILMDRMANELSADILLHVTRELDSRPRLRAFDERLKDEIRSKLCTKADGMFRWVQCQIDTFDKCASVSELRRVLESLPKGLEETYRRILIAIDRRLSDARLVRRALVWLVASLQPMRMRELLEGLTIDPIRRALDPRFALIKSADLLEVCRCLVIHHEETDIITLSHMSVKEYLVGELVHDKLPRYHIVVEDAHERLARLCMAYIAFCLEQMKESRDRSSILMRERHLRLTTSYTSRPLLKYVLSDGFNHLGHLGSGNDEIFKDIETLQVAIRRYALEWDQMCKLLPSNHSGVPWPTSEHDFTFYTLVAFSSDALFQSFVRHTALKPMDGTNPLVYAAHFGKTEHARVLISQGAHVNHPGLVVDDIDRDSSDGDGTRTDESNEDNSDADTGESNVGKTADRRVMPLEVAVEHWHAEMIDLLLVEECIVLDQLLTRVLTKQPDEYPLCIIRRLLQTAEFEEWVVPSWNNQPLLEAMVECEGDDPGQSGAGDLVMCVQRLVEVGRAQTLSGETILHIAAEKGCIHAVERLLSTNTTLPLDIVSFALRGASPERVDIVRLLIRHGADVNPLAVNGDTPLHIAIRSFDEIECLRVTQILVEAGSDPCRPDTDDRPPVHLAVTRGFVSVVEYLLEKGVPLPRRILFAAMQTTAAKRDKMVRLLVRKGADVHALDYDTLLQVAVSSVDESDSLEIAKIIVNAGYSPSTCNSRDEATLHLTVINKYLLSSLPSEDILSALAYPPTRAQILAFILGKVDCIRPVEGNKYTLQDIAQRLTNNPDRCLRAAEAFISIQHNLSSWNYGAVLAALFDNAVAHGSFSTVEYLLSQDVPLPSSILFSALSLEAQSANEAIKMVGFLVAEGADARVLGANGDNLLHVAASRFSLDKQCLEVTKTLVEAGCNPSVLNAEGHTAIQIAVTHGFVDVVEYLLSLDVPLLLFSVLEHRNPQTIRLTRLLVEKGADVHAVAFDGASLVHVAVRSFEERECLQLTQIFARAGSNLSTLDAQGEPPIQIALTRGFAFVVEYLLLEGVPFPQDIFFIIFQWQNRHIYTDVARFTSILLRRGADINVLAPNGDGLLHAAIRFHDQARCLDVTRLIIKAGCSTSMLDADGKAPVQLAVNREFFSVAEYLLLNGAQLPPNILLTLFENQLEHDSIRRVLRIVAFLIRNGADVHARAAGGDTPLHVALAPHRQVPSFATRFFLSEIVKLLVRAGGDARARNALGRTPLDLAVAMGYHEIEWYLSRSAGRRHHRSSQPTVATTRGTRRSAT